VIEIGTKTIVGAGEIIRGVAQREMMATGLMAEGKGTAAMGELLHGGNKGAAAATMTVFGNKGAAAATMTAFGNTGAAAATTTAFGNRGAAAVTTTAIVTVRQEAKGMSHGTEPMDEAENEMGGLENVVMMQDTAAGVEMCASDLLRTVQPEASIRKHTAVAAGNGREHALSGPHRRKTV